MRIEILLGHLQSKLQAFLFGKGSKTHMSLFQHLRYITFRKIQAESLTLRFTEVKQLVSQVQQPFRILLHYIQVFPRFRIDLFLQYDVFQRTFNQRQRCTYLVGHIRKEINLCMINFTFLLLLEFLHLPAVFAVTASLEIHNRIQGAADNQQSIHTIRPYREIKRRKNMYP